MNLSVNQNKYTGCGSFFSKDGAVASTQGQGDAGLAPRDCLLGKKLSCPFWLRNRYQRCVLLTNT